MKSSFTKILIFLTSSILISALLYFQVKIVHLQQILLFLIALILIILRFMKTPLGKKSLKDWLLTLIITFFIQVLVASSGAVFSPFFVLIHLYVIGLSLFFDFWIAMSFLVLEIAVLILNIYFSQNLFFLVKQDFGSVLLYFFSVLAITPVSKFISQQYHIKSDTLKLLFKELGTQESIIEQIDDFLITTDKDLTVIQTNDSAKKVIDLSKSNEFTDLINLVDDKGNRLTKEGLLLSLSSLMQNKQNLNLIMKEYSLKIPNQKVLTKVIIRVTPVLSQNGIPEKFIFLISQKGAEENANTAADRIKEAHTKFISLVNNLKHDPTISTLTAINLHLETLKRYEEDLMTTLELNLNSAPLRISVVDILKTSTQIFKEHQQEALNFNIDYQLNLPENLQEEYNLKIAGNTLPEDLIALSSLSVAIDSKLLQILIEKTFDVATAIAYDQNLMINEHAKQHLPLHSEKALVQLQLSPSQNNIKLSITIKMDLPSPLIQKLLEINKDNWEGVDNLSLSSGLESYILKRVLNLTGAFFKTEFNQYNHNLSLDITLDKDGKSPLK